MFFLLLFSSFLFGSLGKAAASRKLDCMDEGRDRKLAAESLLRAAVHVAGEGRHVDDRDPAPLGSHLRGQLQYTTPYLSRLKPTLSEPPRADRTPSRSGMLKGWALQRVNEGFLLCPNLMTSKRVAPPGLLKFPCGLCSVVVSTPI